VGDVFEVMPGVVVVDPVAVAAGDANLALCGDVEQACCVVDRAIAIARSQAMISSARSRQASPERHRTWVWSRDEAISIRAVCAVGVARFGGPTVLRTWDRPKLPDRSRRRHPRRRR